MKAQIIHAPRNFKRFPWPEEHYKGEGPAAHYGYYSVHTRFSWPDNKLRNHIVKEG